MERVEITKQDQGWTIILPESIDFLGEAVYLKPLGSALILLPAANPWQILFESLTLFSEDCFEDWPETRPQDLPQEREEWFP
ncbi:hypothetical protein AMR42_14720 [Limnothrix sp. PR1529]|nr:AbrB/MazE/SpoVT family DNA-binding domain-containing protein [Limnothrix sp. PR1529]OCQ91518.1 hypothetical protein BCR12_11905 [Limnothrix sp. P13C2]PIB06769.1 hypothetical protein AMR42_14720 [Limnothrix sp. PR1529]